MLMRAGGTDAEHVRDHGLQDESDLVILAFARDNRFVVVSEDTDFGELLARANRRSLARAVADQRELAVLAEDLYPDHRLPGAERTGVITCPSWIPAQPIPLGRVVLDQLGEAPTAVGGTETEGALSRPLATAEQRYRRYSRAIRDLAPPAPFENRLCFRLLGVNWSQPALQLSFGAMGFFDTLDTNELLAHETALNVLARTRSGEYEPVRPSWRGFKFRKLIGDPFDLTRRPLMGAIGTLTIRGGESPSVVLHQRDGARGRWGRQHGPPVAGGYLPAQLGHARLRCA